MRIRDIINEGAESDLQMRQTAMQVLEDLRARRNEPLQPAAIDMYKNQPNDANYESVAWTPTIIPNLIIGFITNAEDPLFINLAEKTDSDRTIPPQYTAIISYPGFYTPRGKSYPKQQAQMEAVKAIQTGKATMKYLIQRMFQEGAETFVHEFTHYWDYKRGAPTKHGQEYDDALTINRAANDAPGPAYFNDVSERNAHTNEMLSLIDQYPYFWNRPFSEFYNRVIRNTSGTRTQQTRGTKGIKTRPTYHDFIKALDPKNRKRLLNRLYQAWELRSKHAKAPVKGPGLPSARTTTVSASSG